MSMMVLRGSLAEMVSPRVITRELGKASKVVALLCQHELPTEFDISRRSADPLLMPLVPFLITDK